MLPSDLTDFAAWPTVETFVNTRLTPHFADVRGLLERPGYNFLAATGLCSIISGISVSLFKPVSANRVKKRKGKANGWRYTDSHGADAFLGTSELFRVLLETFYPWDASEASEQKAKVVYDFVRNPLAHALGENKKPGYTIRIRKSKEDPPGSGTHVGLAGAQLTQLEMATARPADLKLAIDGAGKTWDFRVESFYWGVYQLLLRLAKDISQMAAAQTRFSNGEFIWHR
jgi:hypothetical protein